MKTATMKPLEKFEGAREFVLRNPGGTVAQRHTMGFKEAEERNARRMRAGLPFSARLWQLANG